MDDADTISTTETPDRKPDAIRAASPGIITLTFLFSLIGQASAYIDPGTGGMIISTAGGGLWALLIASAATVTALVLRYWAIVKAKTVAIWKKLRR